MMKKRFLCFALSVLCQQMYGDSWSAHVVAPSDDQPATRKTAASLGYASLSYWDAGFGKALQAGDYSISFNGYVRADYFYDTRASLSFREQYILILPFPKVPDINGCDIYDQTKFNFLAIQTQLGTLVTGPSVLSARTRAYVEGDFTGSDIIGSVLQDRSVINSLLLRHAFVQLDWRTVSLLMGQFWHPMLPQESASMETVVYYALPFEAVSRNPQFRLTWRAGDNVECIAAAMSQIDFFKSDGPVGPSSIYLRNSRVPNLHGQVRLFHNEHVVGFGVDFKRLQPGTKVTQADNNVVPVAGGSKFNSVSALVYGDFFFEQLDAKFKFIYGENLSDQGMLGGYGVSAINPTTGAKCYTPLRNLSFIADFSLKREVEPGLFIGYTKNIGSKVKLADVSGLETHEFISDPLIAGKYRVYGLQDLNDDLTGDPVGIRSVDSVFGFGPRLKWHKQPVTFAAELRYLRAVYPCSLTLNDCGRATCPRDAVNMVRFIASTYYWF